MSAGAYRPDIDGLRALAVLAVVLFHTETGIVTGGYIGVDVFFVISGFLITKIIHDEQRAGGFSYRHFYLRRARRLLPALFVTLALTFLAGTWLLIPLHMERLSRTTIAALAFVANFEFWSERGYLNHAANFKPLLHTWSLAVEEQFYLIWPLALSGLLALRRAWLVPAVLVVASLASVIASEIWLRIDSGLAFYMLPFRIFELGIGALCVWTAAWRPRAGLAEAMVVAGLGLILFAALYFENFTPFPGWRALVPCIGAALIIQAGAQARVSTRLLTNRVAVWLGLISYSLYLVHWPLFVYFGYIKARYAEPLETVALILLAVALAALLHRYVERPFRYPPTTGKRRANRGFAGACIVAALLLAMPAAWALADRGWPQRFPAPVARALLAADARNLDRWPFVAAEIAAPLDPARPVALIIGDSHARDLFTALSFAGPRHQLRYQAIGASCQPAAGDREIGGSLRFEADAQACTERFAAILASPDMAAADVIILMANWEEEGAEVIDESTAVIAAHSDGRIFVFSPKVRYWDLPVLLAGHGRLEGFAAHANRHQKLVQVVRATRILARRLDGRPASFVNTFWLFCDGTDCPVLTPDGHLTVGDNAHWTEPGARMFGEILKHSGVPLAEILFGEDPD